MAVDGTVAAGFEPVRDLFARMSDADSGYGGQLAVIRRGEQVVDLVAGSGLAADSLTGIFSSSKGLSAIAIGLLIQRGDLDLDAPVIRYWPEFAANGKDAITVRQLLSHQSGLVGTPDLTIDDIIDSEPAAQKLAAAAPLWRPGAMFGYHALTAGVFMEELARRITGGTLHELYEREVRAPRGIDAYLGLPEEQEPRYVPVVGTPPRDLSAYADYVPDDLSALSVTGVLADHDFAGFANERRVRAAGVPAAGGVGSARGLAQAYAATIGPDALLTPETVTRMTQVQVAGLDRVIGGERAFGIVFQRPTPVFRFGSYAAFGHDGVGGTLGFADPVHDIAFGYTRLPMHAPDGPEPYSVSLSAAVRRCAAAAG